MTRNHLRLIETVSLTVIGLSLLGVAAFMVFMDRMGEAFGSVVTSVPIIVQAIRGVGQSSAMQSMADQLAQSQPWAGGDEDQK